MAIPAVSDSTMKRGSASSKPKKVNGVAAGGKKGKSSRREQIMKSKLYGSLLGKSCHQCRQKTQRFTFACKNMKDKDKRCPLHYCINCLGGRYGKKELFLAQLENWKCPKCLDQCNCSCCMKKRGLEPTGALLPKARANGYTCAADMLNANNAAAKDLELNEANDAAVLPSREATPEKPEEKFVDNSRSDEVLNNGAVSPMKSIASEKELVVLLPGELGKENTSDATKCAKFKEISNENDVDGAGEKKSLKRPKVYEVTEVKGNANDDTEVFNEVSEEEAEPDHDNACVPMDVSEAWAGNDFYSDVNNLFPNVDMNSEIEKMGKAIAFPPGTDLTEILDIELPAESVGSALQFLEFCRAFGKALNLKKGDPEAILREIVRKQSLRHGQSTLAVRFQIKVLTLILKAFGTKYPYSLTASDGKKSWMKPLEVLINESDGLKDFPLNWLQEGLHGYHNLDLPKKLTLLNFLCDEALSTEKFRNFIDDQNSRHIEKKREAKSKLAAAKDKEKELRQNFQSEMAKVVLSNEASRPMEEHDALLTKLESDVAEAHAEVLELIETVPKGKNSVAVRIEPEFLDSNGHAFWKFKSVGHDLVLQDIKINDETAAAPDEKWFVYGAEKKDEVDTYIYTRAKILKASEKLKRSM